MITGLYSYSRSMKLSVVLVAAALVVGCQESSTPVGPELEASTFGQETLFAKRGGGNGGGGTLVAEVVVGDGPAGSITSDCPRETGTQWHVTYQDSGCLIVMPAGSSYALTDDVMLIMTTEKGKNGRITHVRLRGQDVIGDAGIMHETDELEVAIPTVPDKNGFTLHVHTPTVEVWRLSGHTGGERVEMIGTIDIGDIVYSVQ